MWFDRLSILITCSRDLFQRAIRDSEGPTLIYDQTQPLLFFEHIYFSLTLL